MRSNVPGVGLVLLFSMFGCGGDDNAAGGTEADGSPSDGGDAGPGRDGGNGLDGGAGDAGAEFAVQIIRNSCGPTDGPAVRILLGSENQDDACAVDELGPRIDLQVWVDPAEIEPVTYSFAPGEATGSALLCSGGPATCRSVESGSVRFESFRNEVGAAGSFVLNGESAEVSGNFDATWCVPDPPEVCG